MKANLCSTHSLSTTINIGKECWVCALRVRHAAMNAAAGFDEGFIDGYKGQPNIAQRYAKGGYLQTAASYDYAWTMGKEARTQVDAFASSPASARDFRITVEAELCAKRFAHDLGERGKDKAVIIEAFKWGWSASLKPEDDVTRDVGALKCCDDMDAERLVVTASFGTLIREAFKRGWAARAVV